MDSWVSGLTSVPPIPELFNMVGMVKQTILLHYKIMHPDHAILTILNFLSPD